MTPKDMLINETISYIEAHLNASLTLAGIAEQVHYSRFHLNRLFADAVGLTIYQYIQRRRMTEAAKLLVHSTEALTAIAYQSGYQSQQAFTHAFKQLYHLSPSQYRMQQRYCPLQDKFILADSYTFEILPALYIQNSCPNAGITMNGYHYAIYHNFTNRGIAA